jgi:hypothetical protein
MVVTSQSSQSHCQSVDSMWTGSRQNGTTLRKRWQGQRSQATPHACLQRQEIMEKKWRWSVQSGKMNCKHTGKISFPSVIFLSYLLVLSHLLDCCSSSQFLNLKMI